MVRIPKIRMPKLPDCLGGRKKEKPAAAGMASAESLAAQETMRRAAQKPQPVEEILGEFRKEPTTPENMFSRMSQLLGSVHEEKHVGIPEAAKILAEQMAGGKRVNEETHAELVRDLRKRIESMSQLERKDPEFAKMQTDMIHMLNPIPNR